MTTQNLAQTKYFMDDPREAQRLDAKVNTSEFIDTFVLPYLAATTPSTIVDIGCGAGAIASAMASQFKRATVKGVDLSDGRLSVARKKCQQMSNIEFIQGSIYDLPFEDNSADFLYTRFLLEYLQDPIAAIKQMHRVCKPSGMVMLQDLDGQLLFHYPQTIENLDKIVSGLAETGFDPMIGRKLLSYGLEAGFELVDIDITPYHKILGKVSEKDDYLWDLKLEIALPQFEKILGSRELAQKFKDDFMNHMRQENAILYSNKFTVYLRKP